MEGEDFRLGRIVAIKIPKSRLGSQKDSSWFYREAKAAARLRHPFIVGVFDVGFDRALTLLFQSLSKESR